MRRMTEISILIVEDDPSLRRSLAATTRAAGYRPIEAASLDEARRMRAHLQPNIILLDLGLPDGDGLAFIAAVRADGLTPIVVLSARDAEAMKVAALDAGADDYITKPFGVDELLARLRAAARHAVQAAGSAPVVRTGALEIDLAARVVSKNGREIDLSPKEFTLLATLAERVGKVVRHRELLKAAWNDQRADVQYLRVYIGQLRGKIGDTPTPTYIVSDPGVGYRLVEVKADVA
jgi:two-component system KDP operon response regulator KdpE